MDDPGSVRGGESARHLRGEGERELGTHRLFATQPRAKAFALEQLHDDVAPTRLVLSIVEHVDDAGVTDRRRSLCLGEKSLGIVAFLAELLLDELDYGFAAQ